MNKTFDKAELVPPYKHINVREIVTDEGGVERYFRRIIYPGDDVSSEVSEIQDLANQEWTSEALAAYQNSLPKPPTPEEALLSWREVTFIPKDQFLANCADLGLISDQEAIDGARGIWPTSFDGALADKPAKDSRNSKMRFAAAVNISRNHPDIEDLRLFADLTPKQVDGLFQ